MLWPVVDHVAALAEGREIGVGVVRGVVITMGRRQHHPRPTDPTEDVSFCTDPDPAFPPIAPPTGIRVPPATIAQMVDHPPVWPPAALAATFRPPEPDYGRELRPVDRVEEAVLGPDRHADAGYAERDPL